MSGAGFAGALTAGDEYGRDAEVEALAEVAGHFCGQTQPHDAHVWTTPATYGAATFVSTYQCAGYTRRPAAPGGVPVEALRELADEWDEAADKWPYAVWYDNQKALVRHLRALLPTATTDGGAL